MSEFTANIQLTAAAVSVVAFNSDSLMNERKAIQADNKPVSFADVNDSSTWSLV